MIRHKQPQYIYIIQVMGLLLLLAVTGLSCGQKSNAGSTPNPPFSCHIMQVSGGYGYVVMHEYDTIISQPFIPALRGRQPFSTKAEAEAVGQLVCSKMTAGSPPTLSTEEVESCLLQAKH